MKAKKSRRKIRQREVQCKPEVLLLLVAFPSLCKAHVEDVRMNRHGRYQVLEQ